MEEFLVISKHKAAEESPGFLLWRVSILWRRKIERVLKPLKLTHPQFVILATTGWLTKEGKGASQIEIGRLAGLDANTTSQILRSLEKKGFLERRPSSDERSKQPFLTHAGKRLLALALPAVETADEEFFSKLDLPHSSFLQGLQKLSQST